MWVATSAAARSFATRRFATATLSATRSAIRGRTPAGRCWFEYNKFDNDRDGFDTNSQNNSDWPSPQNGACINGVKPPVKGAKTCWLLTTTRSTTTTRTFRWQELVLFGQHPRGGAIVPRDVNNPVSRYD